MYDGGVCVSGAEIASLAGILHLRRSIRTAIGFDDQEMSELADRTHIAVVTRVRGRSGPRGDSFDLGMQELGRTGDSPLSSRGVRDW